MVTQQYNVIYNTTYYNFTIQKQNHPKNKTKLSISILSCKIGRNGRQKINIEKFLPLDPSQCVLMFVYERFARISCESCWWFSRLI